MYKFNPSDMSEKVGLEQNIFSTGTQRKEVKEKDKRSKTSKVKHTIFQYFNISILVKIILIKKYLILEHAIDSIGN